MGGFEEIAICNWRGTSNERDPPILPREAEVESAQSATGSSSPESRTSSPKDSPRKSVPTPSSKVPGASPPPTPSGASPPAQQADATDDDGAVNPSPQQLPQHQIQRLPDPVTDDDALTVEIHVIPSTLHEASQSVQQADATDDDEVVDKITQRFSQSQIQELADPAADDHSASIETQSLFPSPQAMLNAANSRPPQPNLPDPVDIWLPVRREDGTPVETDNFPVSLPAMIAAKWGGTSSSKLPDTVVGVGDDGAPVENQLPFLSPQAMLTAANSRLHTRKLPEPVHISRPIHLDDGTPIEARYTPLSPQAILTAANSRQPSRELPGPVDIPLPICLDDGTPIETRSFPLSAEAFHAEYPATPGMPSGVVRNHKHPSSAVASGSASAFNARRGQTNHYAASGLRKTRQKGSPYVNSSPKLQMTQVSQPMAGARQANAPVRDSSNRYNIGNDATYELLDNGRTQQRPETVEPPQVHDDSSQSRPSASSDTSSVEELREVTDGSSEGEAPSSASDIHSDKAAPDVDEDMSAQNRKDETGSAPQTPETPKHVYNDFAQGLYARERNPRRAATKQYRQPTSPPTLRNAKSEQPSKETVQPTSSVKKRSSSDDQDQVRKRGKRDIAPYLNADGGITYWHVPFDDPPERAIRSDGEYVSQLAEILKLRSKDGKADMGKRQAARILDLLDLASYPTKDEALFLKTEEAKAALAPGTFHNCPIITKNQQIYPLQTPEDFLREYYDDDCMIWIQDPEVRPSKKAQITRQVRVSQVRERLAGPESDKPWNCLELATHTDDGLKPGFLMTEDCRLLTKLKIPEPLDKPEARRRPYPVGYKEVEKWALVAQAGALTEPHQDSHGFSTYITINTGQVGFGWLSFPTPEERASWRKSPSTFRGGKWRYVVLKAGQTVYFPGGTVHFVFRLPSVGNTLAFGGHVLRCSNIVHWVRTMIEERDCKDITNEDLTEMATGYLLKVEKFVRRARVDGTEARWGGEGNIAEFLTLKARFLSQRQR